MDMQSEQYGYDQSIFVSDVPDYFNCMICSLVLRDPVLILSCGHKMCSPCFERIKTHTARNGTELQCPIDRELVDVSDVREDICSKRIVGNMVARCYYHDGGCEWTGDLREVDTHTDMCPFKPHRQVDQEAELVTQNMLKDLTCRLEQCESSLIDKDKQIYSLKHQVQEQQESREELQSLKEQVSQLAWKNMELERRQQQQHEQHEKQQQQDIADLQQKNKMMECQMSALTQKNVELEQRLQSQQQQHDRKLQQQHEQHLKLQQQHEQHLKLQQAHEQEIGDLKGIVETVQKKLASFTNGDGNTPLTAVVSTGSCQATACLVKEQIVVAQEMKIAVEIHSGDVNSVTISNDTKNVQFRKLAIVSARRAVVPQGKKAWYEVKCIRTMIGWVIRVGWATFNLPLSEKCNKRLGDDPNGYAFSVFSAYKFHNGATKWGAEVTGNSVVVGVALDMVKGEVLFSVNGQWTAPMGVAFTDIPKDMKLFPAFSGNTNTSLQYNFGGDDFTFGPPNPTFLKLLDVI